VAAAARKAGVTTTTVYDARRNNIAFARKWQAALCEGYDNLELELLYRLRTGELKPPTTRKTAVRTFDNANALRLLAAHRESAAQERAMREDDDAETILAGLNAKLERMREGRWPPNVERTARMRARPGIEARSTGCWPCPQKSACAACRN
jgi:hypothetical protein